MRQLNLDELLDKLNDYSTKTQYADKNHYLQNLSQSWNFIISQDKSNCVLKKIEKEYEQLNIKLQDKNIRKQQKLKLLNTYEIQGAFGYFNIKELLSSSNLRVYDAFNLSSKWYGNRQYMNDSKDVFNDNFFVPFMELLIWYLEESQSYNSTDYFSKKEVEIFEEKLDKIKEIIYTLKDGQEIIFDEIEDLQEQLLHSKKKNWTEMFKGKFYDFVFQKIITETMFKEAFNILTGKETSALGDYIKSLP